MDDRRWESNGAAAQFGGRGGVAGGRTVGATTQRPPDGAREILDHQARGGDEAVNTIECVQEDCITC